MNPGILWVGNWILVEFLCKASKKPLTIQGFFHPFRCKARTLTETAVCSDCSFYKMKRFIEFYRGQVQDECCNSSVFEAYIITYELIESSKLSYWFDSSLFAIVSISYSTES